MVSAHNYVRNFNFVPRFWSLLARMCEFSDNKPRLADQVRTIIKKSWFSDLEILEIHQKTHKQNYNTVPDTSSSVKQKQPTKNKLLTSENENIILPNTTLPNNAQPNNHKETLSQEQKINLKKVQRIMNCEKTTLLSLRNIEWRTLNIVEVTESIYGIFGPR